MTDSTGPALKGMLIIDPEGNNWAPPTKFPPAEAAAVLRPSLVLRADSGNGGLVALMNCMACFAAWTLASFLLR